MTRLAGLSCAVAVAATLWCALAVAPPFMERAGRATPAILTRLLFDPLCHQMAQRSFHVADRPMAVCARCFGVYAGFAAGCWFAGALGLFGWRRPPASGWPLVAAAAPGAMEWIAEQAGLLGNAGAAPARALTGALFGMVVAAYLIPALAGMIEQFGEGRARRTRAGGMNAAAG